MLRFVVIFSSLLATIHCFDCKDSGNGYFRDPEDCAKMIRCSDGKITHRFSCSEGKVFNDITKSCDDPKYVNCHNSVTETTSSTTSPSSVPSEEPSLPAIAARLQSPFLTHFASSSMTTTQLTTPTTESSQDISTTTSFSSSTQRLPKETTTLTSKTTSSDDLITETTPKLIETNYESITIENKTQIADQIKEVMKSKKNISLNESFVEYEENPKSLPFNESFVEFVDDIEITTTITSEEVKTTESSAEFTTESTTVATSTPTSIRSDVSPVLESVLQNETLMETTESPEPEITTQSKPYCAIDQSSVGFRMVSSNYSTNETSKLTDYFKVVCYFTNWSRYRSESAKFTAKNINPFLCTHIIYAFAILDNQTLTMKSSDECTDIDNKYYEQITSLKERNPRLKVMIALGGWADSEGDKYSRLVSNQTNRVNFIEKAIQFLNEHNFDGLDLDWEYPKCWHADCRAGPISDKLNFAKLIHELKIAFNQQSRPLLLTAAVGASQYIGDNAYEFNSLMINLDFINLMTYDFYTAGSEVAAHHSPLYSHPNAKDLYHSVSNANFSVNYWIRKGVPSYKLIMGIPFYGRTFKLMNSKTSEYGSAVNGTGNQGIYTKESGFLSYYEICTNILRNGWAKRMDTYVRGGKPLMTGPYAYNEDQWVGYDDRDHIIQKTEFIKDNGLGGAMVWALDLDDFNGICCKTKSPLLKTINKELRDYRFDLKFFCP